MNADDLFSECWHDLPLIRKHIAGKENVRQAFMDTLREWDSSALGKCLTDYQVEMYERGLLARVQRRSADKYGFVILTVILIAVISAVISWLVQRWLDRTFPKAEFEAMRVGL